MDSTADLGILSKANVRDVWKHEAHNFTPWLCENIEPLGKELGLLLEFVGREEAVGPYSADILAKDAGNDRYVVIENQLEKTNHDHLGKCITYSSVLDASAFIWLATEFTDEHKKAIDWLNEHTTEDIACYGVQLELWKVDDSKPALKYNVICRPNEAVREAKKQNQPLTETKLLRLEFWTQFDEAARNSNIITANHSPKAQTFYDIPLGKSSIVLSNVVFTTTNQIGCRVYMSSKMVDEWLGYFMDHKDEVEQTIGCELEWDRNKKSKDKVIALFKDFKLSNQEEWDEAITWLVETSERFYNAFTKLIRKKA